MSESAPKMMFLAPVLALAFSVVDGGGRSFVRIPETFWISLTSIALERPNIRMVHDLTPGDTVVR